MNPEDKDLLFKDLCARLPYGVKIEENGYFGGKLVSIENFNINGVDMLLINGADLSKHIIKPYLFPLSSMTEEQREEYAHIWENCSDKEFDSFYKNDVNQGLDVYKLPVAYEIIDWLNSRHFDYRGLIDKGLAINATNLNIY